jgi:hypothetical protein
MLLLLLVRIINHLKYHFINTEILVTVQKDKMMIINLNQGKIPQDNYWNQTIEIKNFKNNKAK